MYKATKRRLIEKTIAVSKLEDVLRSWFVFGTGLTEVVLANRT